jgi:hypothetical protein
MKSSLLALVAIAFACSLHANPAQAQRVFVSATGLDTNPCTFASPCRSFQHAHDVAAANGEIDVLDPAGYGPVTITKAISIQGHGFSGITVASGGTGITINATSTDNVALNGLLIEGGQVGSIGIRFNSGALLTVENCTVRNVPGSGLTFAPTAAAKLAVSNSYFDGNGDGIDIDTLGSGAVSASVDRTGLYGNFSAGIFVTGANGTGALNVAVTDSISANNFYGFFVVSSSGHSVTNLSLTHVLAEGNGGVGIRANQPNATLWLAQSTVSGNAAGFSIGTGSVINSYLDNYFANNGASTGSLATVGKQ